MTALQIIFGFASVLFFGLGIVFLNISKNQLDNAKKILEEAKLEKAKALNISSRN